MSSDSKPIFIRQVWRHNLISEFELIRNVLDRFPYVSMDTEFPGVVYRPSGDYFRERRQQPSDLYYILRSNVNVMNLIQVGFTFTDSEGNLPDLDSGNRFIWEFNFHEFDLSSDLYSYDSIELLKNQGMDFERNRSEGIDCNQFAELMMSSGLVCNGSVVNWISFHSAYDFGYLVKMLTCRNLPEDVKEFLEVLKVFFGNNVYDVKYIMQFCSGLYGGLDRVAKTLQVERVAGKCHQAGSDSLLTWHAFQKIRDNAHDGLEMYAGFLYGLKL